MSHVDEGTLHAFLDGELSSSERAGVDAHLAQCAACRARLAEERALLERASALLGSARPIERPAPPFEHVRRAPRRRPWYVRTPVAWAASIVLALGVGYYLAGPLGRVPTAPLEQRSAPAPASGSLLATAPEEQRGQQEKAAESTPRTGRRRAAIAPPTDVAQARDSVRVDSARWSDSTVAGVAALQPRVMLRGGAPAQRVADSLAAARREPIVLVDGAVLNEAPVRAEHERRNAAAAAAALAPAPAPAPAPAAARVRRDDGRSVRNLVATTWPVISRGVAASMLGDKPVGVPGLATRQIRRNPTGDGTVVVEQALDSSTVIQIFQRPASIVGNVDSTARLYSGLERERADRVLSRYVGRLRVEISGPVSTDSLNRLLEQVEPIP